MKTIELTKGKFTMVDDDDFEELNQHKWYANKMGNILYAVRNIETPKRAKIYMHRSIMNTPNGLQTDHINGNGLDNRKENLRAVTARQNTQNKHTNKSSIYAGVNWSKVAQKWHARICIKGSRKHLGYFKTEIDAYNSYLKALEDIGEVLICNYGIKKTEAEK